MKKLFIFGAGGLGKEVGDIARRIGLWEEIAFIDDNLTVKEINKVRVYNFEEALSQYDNEDMDFIVAVGEPSTRKKLYKKLLDYELNIISIIDPGFIMSDFSLIEKGTIVHTGAIITCNTHIGFGSVISKNAAIGHDITMGEYCVVSPNAVVSGGSKIGNNCYIGCGAMIRNNTTIGDNSIIGMGAVVVEDVAPDSVMVGNPAILKRKNVEKKVFR